MLVLRKTRGVTLHYSMECCREYNTSCQRPRIGFWCKAGVSFPQRTSPESCRPSSSLTVTAAGPAISSLEERELWQATHTYIHTHIQLVRLGTTTCSRPQESPRLRESPVTALQVHGETSGTTLWMRIITSPLKVQYYAPQDSVTTVQGVVLV